LGLSRIKTTLCILIAFKLEFPQAFSFYSERDGGSGDGPQLAKASAQSKALLGPRRTSRGPLRRRAPPEGVYERSNMLTRAVEEFQKQLWATMVSIM